MENQAKNHDELARRLLDIIEKGASTSGQGLSLETLISDTEFNSFKLIQLFVQIENEFGIQIADEYLNWRRFNTIGDLVNTFIEIIKEQ